MTDYIEATHCIDYDEETHTYMVITVTDVLVPKSKKRKPRGR